MQSAPWGSGHDTVVLGRMFEYTDDEVAAAFRDGNRVLFDKLIQLPCLFMLEGTGDQFAYAGTITRARVVGPQISIEYTLDADIPPLLNSTIFSKKLDFGMPHDFEFSRNHWAVKDLDLYRLLLRNFRPRRQRPSVFTIPDNEKIELTLVSVMMPFDASFTSVYESIKATAAKVALRCRRADDIWENPAIIQDIVALIDRSRVVIGDCTGRNPNVFYEIGIAHTLGREVILITRSAADIPFDLRHLRHVQYLNNAEGREALSSAIQTRFNAIFAND